MKGMCFECALCISWRHSQPIAGCTRSAFSSPFQLFCEALGQGLGGFVTPESFGQVLSPATCSVADIAPHLIASALQTRSLNCCKRIYFGKAKSLFLGSDLEAGSHALHATTAIYSGSIKGLAR